MVKVKSLGLFRDPIPAFIANSSGPVRSAMLTRDMFRIIFQPCNYSRTVVYVFEKNNFALVAVSNRVNGRFKRAAVIWLIYYAKTKRQNDIRNVGKILSSPNDRMLFR